MPATKNPEVTMLKNIDEGFREPGVDLHYDYVGMARGETQQGLQIPRFIIVLKWNGDDYQRRMRIVPIKDGDTDEPARQQNLAVTYNLSAAHADIEPVVDEESETGTAIISSPISAAAEARPLVVDHKIATLLIPEIVKYRSTP